MLVYFSDVEGSFVPTNDRMVDERYNLVGWGPDYADVPPLRGIIHTDSESSVIEVAAT